MTKLLEREAPASLLRREVLLVSVLVWAAFVSIPLSGGGIGLSWDALNHHVYLGWVAQRPRFDLDWVAAGYQSYQYPYLYWPFYKMAALGWTGMSAGIVLVSLHALAVPPVWMLARVCIPGRTVFDLVMRWLAVALAFLTGTVLSLVDSSQNDLLAAVPLVWALAFAMQPVAAELAPAATRRWVVLSGFCAGLAVAAKFSNGPLVILLPVLWLLCARGLRGRAMAAALGSLAALAAFALAYGYWGLQLWQHFGNPVYPFYESLFAPLRARLGGG